MVWTNHIIITTCVARLIDPSLHPIYYGLIAFGSIFPDWIERLGTRIRIIPHRTITHSITFWGILIPLVWILLQYGIINSYFADILNMSFLKQQINNLDFLKVWNWFSFGIVAHLLEDLTTKTGLPIFYKKRRVALRWIRTGELKEYYLSTILLFIVIYIEF